MKYLICIALMTGLANFPTAVGAHTDPPWSGKSKPMKSPWVTTPRKPQGSDIDLRYRYTHNKPYFGINETVTIELEFSGASGKDPKVLLWQDPSLSATTQSLSAAGISKAQEAYSRSLSKPTQSLSISLTANTEGLHYLHISSEQDGKASVAAIPIRIGNKPLNLPTLGEVRTLADGKKVIEMKAN